MQKLIKQQKSVIPACDVADLNKLEELAEATADVPGISALKVGLELVIPFGLARVVRMIRKHSQLPIIYDHQKGGTDIPDLGLKFARAVKRSGADAVILFPFGGAATAEEWIDVCQREELVVLVGGHMTQPRFLESEGGFIADSGPEAIYRLAAERGVTDFVVPGNKTDFVLRYRQFLEGILGAGNFTLYAPGFISQGGDISETGKVAGDNWHAIVGSAIYKKEGVEEMRQAAEEVTSQIAGVNNE
jgi:orotidine-5'-phosphate decarboxylase